MWEWLEAVGKEYWHISNIVMGGMLVLAGLIAVGGYLWEGFSRMTPINLKAVSWWLLAIGLIGTFMPIRGLFIAVLVVVFYIERKRRYQPGGRVGAA